jgi:hypothetical protein
MLQEKARSDVAAGHVASGQGASAGEAWPVDERNPFWTKYREIADQVIGRAKEPFEIEDDATPCTAHTIGMATRYAIRLALREGEVPDAARRKEIAERAYMATAERFWTSDASQGAAALDEGLRYAVLHVLSASGVEQRWDEAAAYQAAWERTEIRASVPFRAARWVAHLWPIAVGIGIGAAIGLGGGFIYYFVIAPLAAR